MSHPAKDRAVQTFPDLGPLKERTSQMTKKDFRAIADVIRFLDQGLLGPISRAHVADQFADFLKTTNPRFDRQKFLDACGFPLKAKEETRSRLRNKAFIS